MTYEGWKQVVEQAYDDPVMKDLLVKLLVEQDAAKSELSAYFGWIGLPWPRLVENIFKVVNQ